MALRNTSILVAGGLFLVSILFASTNVGAAIVTFDDRAAWEAALAGSAACEDFENEPIPPFGTTPTPHTTNGGVLFDTLTSPVTLQYLDPGLLGSREYHWRDFAAGVRISFPGAITAFGFDYDTGGAPGDDTNLTANGVTTLLPRSATGFIGYIEDTGAPIPFLDLVGSAGAQGGISIDDLCWATEIFYGLNHEAINDAELNINAQGQIVVSNIGSSGQDGVSIELGEAEFQLIGFEPASGAPALPDGAFVEITTNGELDGQPDQFIWSLRVEDIGDEFGLALDSSTVQAGSLRVEARLGDQIVNSVIFDPPPAADDILVRFPPTGCVVDPFWEMIPECWAIVALANPELVTITGSAPVMADSIVVASVDQVATVGSLSNTVMLAADVSELTLFDEALGMFDLPHRSLGQATFEAQGDQLTISNIGSSGNDGVSIDVTQPGSPVLAWGFETPNELDPSLLPTGAFRQTSLLGNISGQGDQLTAQTRVEDLGDVVRRSADFSFIGSPTQTIQLFLDGNLVAEASGYSGPGIDIAAGPAATVMENYLYRRNGSLKSCTIVTTGAQSMQIVGGPATMANRIVIAPENPQVVVDGLTSVRLEAAGVDQITLLDEQILTPSIFTDGFESGDTTAWSASVP